MKALLSRIYPGWRVHASVFLCAMVVVGCTSYIFGLFVIPVTEEFDITRGTANNGYIAFLLGVGIMSPLVGRLLDKVPARLVLGAGGLVFGLGMLGLSRSHSPLLMLVLIIGPVAFGMTACGTLAANTVVARWFRNRRGRALGILAVSTSAGGFIFTPVTAMLIESLGWRDALMTIGLFAMAVVGLVVTLTVKDRPSGDEPGYDAEFGDPEADRVAATDGQTRAPAREEEREWPLGQLLRNRNFWLLSLGVGLLYGSDQAMVTSNVPYFQDIGIDLADAAFIVSFMTVSAITGKVLVGTLADKLDLRWVFHAVGIAHIAILVIYLAQPSYWVLLVLATLFGLGVGGVFPVWTTMVAWLFGSRSYGTIMGLMTVLFKAVSIVAVRFIGEVHDMTGSYVVAFWTFMAMVTVAMVLISLIRPMENTGSER